MRQNSISLELKKQITPSIFSIGQEYYNQRLGNLTALFADGNFMTVEGEYHENNLCKTSITVEQKKGEFVEANCECNFFKNNRQNCCKHVVTLGMMADKSEKIIKVIGTDDMEMMFEDDFEEDNKKLAKLREKEQKTKAEKAAKRNLENDNKNKSRQRIKLKDENINIKKLDKLYFKNFIKEVNKKFQDEFWADFESKFFGKNFKPWEAVRWASNIAKFAKFGIPIITGGIDIFLQLRNDQQEKKIEKQIKEAKNKKVLNLFSYTGSFSVHAAKGGAASVDSVDLSNTYLNWAKENLKLNKLFDEEKTRLIKSDVIVFLKKAIEEQKKWDLIICDPPTFSNSKSADIFDVNKDWLKLCLLSLKVLSKNGKLYFSTNSQKIKFDEAELINSSKQKIRIKDITKASIPEDFRNQKIHKMWMIEYSE